MIAQRHGWLPFLTVYHNLQCDSKLRGAQRAMHSPDDVRKILHEFESAAPAIGSSRNQQAIRDYDGLIPVLIRLDQERRMLFVQVAT